MDGTASREEKASSCTGDGASSEQQPAPPLSAGALGVKIENGGGEDEDEQVEKFFALLANIRALRAIYGAAFAGGGAGCGERLGADGRGRKRPWEAEPPWRPAFRMEDFEEEEHAEKKVDGTCGAKRVAGTSRVSVAVADADEDDGEVVETSGCPSGRRVAARE